MDPRICRRPQLSLLGFWLPAIVPSPFLPFTPPAAQLCELKDQGQRKKQRQNSLTLLNHHHHLLWWRRAEKQGRDTRCDLVTLSRVTGGEVAVSDPSGPRCYPDTQGQPLLSPQPALWAPRSSACDDTVTILVAFSVWKPGLCSATCSPLHPLPPVPPPAHGSRSPQTSACRSWASPLDRRRTSPPVGWTSAPAPRALPCVSVSRAQLQAPCG